MISFIIPAYDEEKRIHKSLVKLTRYLDKIFKNYEIICVVDGTDRTAQIVRNFILKNSRVKLLEFKKRLVVHMDADLYTSTLYVLTRLAPFLKPNDIIIFDDFSAKLGFAHEFRAFLDFFSSYKYSYEVIAAANLFWHVAIKIDDE